VQNLKTLTSDRGADMFSDFKIIVVGAGFFGATIAERVANDARIPVLVMDKRPHVGGNSWSQVDPGTGIEYHVYGSHLFHTGSEEIWRYITRFSEFTDYRHRVFTVHRGQVYSMPINLGTISSFFRRHLAPTEAQELIRAEIDREGITSPMNLEEKAISLIGRSLYEAFIKGYTAKQWQTDPRQLPSSIITRLPVRLTFDDRYFSDPYEGLPRSGYARVFHNMLSSPNVQIRLNTDFHEIADQVSQQQLVIYTGAIDRFFEYQCGRLGWRTLDFEREVLPTDDFQGTSVMNYADIEVAFTRIHEFKHLHPERRYEPGRTLIAREFSRFAGPSDDPYYPIATSEDKKRFTAYKELAPTRPNVIFGGRLGSYKYIDMHQAIGAALKTYQKRIIPYLASGKLSPEDATDQG
jgi:UDP-galactopyranose mutase